MAAGELNAGLYSFGQDLAGEVTVFSQSLLTVLLPKASGKENPAKLRKFVVSANLKQTMRDWCNAAGTKNIIKVVRGPRR